VDATFNRAGLVHFSPVSSDPVPSSFGAAMGRSAVVPVIHTAYDYDERIKRQ
jgi:hypothetical protein